MSVPRHLFVLGDSISMQYGPHLQALLPAAWRYDRKGGAGTDGSSPDDIHRANGGDSAMVLAWLKDRIATDDFRPDLLLLNCGLHDIKHAVADGPCQVPAKDYRRNLETILMRCKARGLAVVWVRTTPVDDAQHRRCQTAFFRYERDVAEYNDLADRVMAEYQVSSIDLHGFTLALDERPLYCDHVHFTEPVRRLQGAHIAGHLACWGALLDRRRTTAGI
jgi:hypothetical protein